MLRRVSLLGGYQESRTQDDDKAQPYAYGPYPT